MAKGNGKGNKDLAAKLQQKTGDLQEDKKPRTIADYINSMQGEIAKALPKHITPERITRIALTAVRMNPKLATCNANSLLAAIMQSAQLGLEPNTPLGQAYIIPYGKEAQFQLGYKGLIELAHRANMKSLYAREVYSNDHFEIDYGLNESLVHKPYLEGDRGEVIGYYACYHLQTGGYGFEFMTKAEVEQHRDRFSPSAARGSSPWKSDFDSMAKKTVIKKALKYAPISVEMQKVLNTDESVKTKIDEDMHDVKNEIYDIEAEYEVMDDQDDLEGTPFEEGK